MVLGGTWGGYEWSKGGRGFVMSGPRGVGGGLWVVPEGRWGLTSGTKGVGRGFYEWSWKIGGDLKVVPGGSYERSQSLHP